MDPAVKEALLKDPVVQQKIQAAGENALNDPEVQAQIMKTCQEKFPQYAAQASGAVSQWANDPATQAKAKEYAGVALGALAGAGGSAVALIEQGPDGVRVLAFFASMGSFVLALMQLINVLAIFGHPILYVVAVYQIVFAFSTVLFELKPEWIETIQSKTGLPVQKYQELLIENAKFLSLNGGRGLFYVFQGSLWLAFAALSEILKLCVGLFLVVIGILHGLMARGIMPQQIAQKVRSGYSQVGAQGAAPLNAPGGP